MSLDVPITGQAMGEALVKRVKEGIVDHGNHTNSIILMRKKGSWGYVNLVKCLALERHI